MEPCEILNAAVDAPLNPQTPAMQNMEQNAVQSDRELWYKVLSNILNGVMFHTACIEQCSQEQLCGFAEMHTHHAEEEFARYLHVLKDYIDEWYHIPEFNPSPQHIKLQGESKEDKMYSALDLYYLWENETCKKMCELKEKMTEETKAHMDYIISDVKEEKRCIRRMMDDLDSGKYEELDCWLKRNYGE